MNGSNTSEEKSGAGCERSSENGPAEALCEYPQYPHLLPTDSDGFLCAAGRLPGVTVRNKAWAGASAAAYDSAQDGNFDYRDL